MVLYLYGSNTYAITHQLKRMKSKYYAMAGPEGDFSRVDLQDKGIGSLISNLATVPMFVSTRLVVVDGISTIKPTPSQINTILDQTPESTILVLIDPNPDKRTSVFKILSKISGATGYQDIPRYKLAAWVKAEARRLGAEIDTNTIEYLLDHVGLDQWTLHNELTKLGSYNSVITKASIDDVSTASFDNTAFDLAESLVKHDTNRAIRLYQQLSKQGHADQMILGAITYQFRTLMIVILNDSRLTNAYHMSSYPLQKARGISGKLDIDDIKSAFRYIARADMATKTGELGSSEAMMGLIYSLAS